MRQIVAFISIFGFAMPAIAAEYRMSLVETGVRDYYCTYTVRLENSGPEPLNDLNGYFVLLDENEPVGESRSSSLLNAASGEVTETVFEAPNAPCDSVNGLQFVVSACRVGQSFRNQADCAANLETVSPILDAVPR